MLGFVLSTIAFFAAVYWAKRYLDEQDINHGMTRNIVVFVFATVVSLVVSAAVDYFDHKPASQQSDVQQVIKLLAQ